MQLVSFFRLYQFSDKVECNETAVKPVLKKHLTRYHYGHINYELYEFCFCNLHTTLSHFQLVWLCINIIQNGHAISKLCSSYSWSKLEFSGYRIWIWHTMNLMLTSVCILFITCLNIFGFIVNTLDVLL